MRRFLLSISILVFSINAFSQGGVWTWVKGDSVVVNTVSMGNYGALGIPDQANEPPGRYHGTYWTDTSDNYWIFGGQIFNIGPLNDLWRYTKSTNTWTWMSGAQIITNTAGVLGTQGVPSVNNYPPSCDLTGFAWTDTNNNLWLLHKWGDLWRFNISTNEWTWMNGAGIWNATAVFGTQGVPNAANHPPHNSETKCSWKDANDRLYCYIDGNMWRYDISTNMWTWLHGPGAGPSLTNYGTMGVPAASNHPPMGNSYTYWTGQDGLFYMGFNITNNTTMWRYDPNTNMWTWFRGQISAPTNGGRMYISQCTGSVNRNPGTRVESRGASHKSSCTVDLMWFCGGQSFGYFNDLWVYKPSLDTWTWVSGDSISGQYGNYGVQGVPAATNMLADRTGHAMWVDSLQQVWIFGGLIRGSTSRGNDLWKFVPDLNCLGVVLDTFHLYPPIDTVLCLGESTSLFADEHFSITVNPATGYTFNADTTLITFTPSTTTTYTVSGVVSALCPTPKQIVFTIHVIHDTMPLFSDAAVCVGEKFTLHGLDTSYQFVFSPASEIQYISGSDSAVCTNAATTTFTVTATKNGCPVQGQSLFTIQKLAYPIADFTVSPSYTVIDNPEFTLTNLSMGAASIRWYLGTQLLDSTQSYSFIAQDTGTYCWTLVAYNTLGCSDTAIHCGDVLPGAAVFIPNAFTPNGDGVNDIFKVVGKNITLLSLRIFNRWGQEVFYTDDLMQGWDGKYKGNACDMDVYFYMAEYSDVFGRGYMKKGDVSLVR